MSSNTQEDPKNLWFEQATFISTHMSSVGYGIHASVYFTVTYFLLKRKRPHKLFWLVFNGFLFAFGTINLACGIHYNENAWVNKREYPGGPFAYLFEQQALPTQTLGNSVAILASFFADGLMLQRVAILYDWNWWIIVPPGLFYVGCVVLSILTVVQLALPDQTSQWPSLSLPVWIILMILPMWLTALIAGRILYQRHRLIKIMGAEAASIYTGVTAVVIESALPFTLISIILLGLFGDNNVAQNLFVSVMVQIECIAPEMIILRVILGHAWTSQTLKPGGGLDRNIRDADAGSNCTPMAFAEPTISLDDSTTRMERSNCQSEASVVHQEDKDRNAGCVPIDIV
ncbi:hypothetical protein E1B28_003270 [Marasmius oreades]|uniref:Uncharacterized protein n=1 Tax=Marasmius oreades TaxID=181124 RepID=A0A9P7UJL0_9AGAR|nr:uncharacterized protein E1B28_003270 [Marasmius oreades]KAG7085727.1 hypothetical protein E1B28_003270 [Marasmius oreades]